MDRSMDEVMVICIVVFQGQQESIPWVIYPVHYEIYWAESEVKHYMYKPLQAFISLSSILTICFRVAAI